MLNPPNGFETWQEYGFAQARLQYESMLATGCEEGTAIRVAQDKADRIQRRIIIEDHPDMLQGRLQFIQHRLAMITDAIHQAVTSPDFTLKKTTRQLEQIELVQSWTDRLIQDLDNQVDAEGYHVHPSKQAVIDYMVLNKRTLKNYYRNGNGMTFHETGAFYDYIDEKLKIEQARQDLETQWTRGRKNA